MQALVLHTLGLGACATIVGKKATMVVYDVGKKATMVVYDVGKKATMVVYGAGKKATMVVYGACVKLISNMLRCLCGSIRLGSDSA